MLLLVTKYFRPIMIDVVSNWAADQLMSEFHYAVHLIMMRKCQENKIQEHCLNFIGRLSKTKVIGDAI